MFMDKLYFKIFWFWGSYSLFLEILNFDNLKLVLGDY